MNDNGFLRLYRRLLDWEWFDNSQMVHLWIYFLLKANYQDGKWHGIEVPRGSFLTSLDNICKDTGLTVQNVRTCINKLKSTSEITIKVTNKYSIITVCKYDLYNVQELEANKQDNKQTNIQLTSNQQATNKQNEEKEKIPPITPLIKEKEGEEEKKERKKIKKDICDANASLSVCTDDISAFDYDGFVKYFNSTLDKHRSNIPRVRAFDDRRKGVVHARLKQYKSVKVLYEVVEKAAKSLFLNGGGKDGWKATFDWIFGPQNFKKVLEGNYDNDRRMGMEVGVNYQGNNTGKFDDMELWK